MINLPAIGVSILILITATAMVRSSSANDDYPFQRSQQTLSKALANAMVNDVMQSYQRQISTISLNRSRLTKPHILSFNAPAGTSLQGQIFINDNIQLPLQGNSASTAATVDISPYLTTAETQVRVTGSYSPPSRAVSIAFTGPGTLVQHQIGGTGQINYHLNVMVD